MRKYIPTFLFIVFHQAVLLGQTPKPEEILGYSLGEQFTYHHEVVDFFEILANRSDKIVIEKYGETYEGRDLILAFISSPENLKDREVIRKRNMNLVNRNSDALDEAVPIIWLSYNIHGNESVSTEAAMKTAYHLINSQEKEISDWLANAIIILDPCENPDGRERYTAWYRQKTQRPFNPHPMAWEHQEPWPGGRFNHYLFDLNRDWAWQTQKESQLRAIIYQKWYPHVHVDLHEMGVNNKYFFAPSAEPFHKTITPWQREFQELCGKNIANYFDKKGWLYFTKELFDLFYPSYGDTWPMFHGAIGFTYEQAGGGRAGLGIHTETGDTLRLMDRIDHHFYASLGTIKATVNNKERLLKEFAAYFDYSKKTQKKYNTYIIKRTNQKDKVHQLLDLLDKNDIDYYQANKARSNVNGYDFSRNTDVKFNVQKGDWLIDTQQNNHHLVEVLFDPKPVLQDSVTYDMTAWALPFAYDLMAFATKQIFDNKTIYKKPDFSSNSVGQPPGYAYLLEWQDIADMRCLSKLFEKGIHVRRSSEPFSIKGRTFARGTLIITQADNRHTGVNLATVLPKIANKYERKLHVVKTGWANIGKDLGSSYYPLLAKPNILLLASEETRPTSVGEIWYFFEQELKYPITITSVKQFNRISEGELGKFNTIILPSGNYRFEKKSALKSFIRAGGTIIALENAVEEFANALGTEVKSKIKRDDDPINYSVPFSEKRRKSISRRVEGAVYKIDLDNTHPLAFGLETTLHIVKRTTICINPLKNNKHWNVGTFGNSAYVSGFVGWTVKENVKETSAIIAERMGQGHIIYFTDSPIIRGFWHGGKLLFANALLMN